MAEYMFEDMPLGLRLEYERTAKKQQEVAASNKREADARTLTALANALKEHGSPEQYASCQAAIVAFYEKTLMDLGINDGSSQVEPGVED